MLMAAISNLRFGDTASLPIRVTVQVMPPAALPGANFLKRLPNRS